MIAADIQARSASGLSSCLRLLYCRGMTPRIKRSVFPRRVLFRSLPCIFSDENGGVDSAVLAIGFCHPNRLAARTSNTVVLHGTPNRLEASNGPNGCIYSGFQLHLLRCFH
jgi:hypothetical protein